MGLLRLPRMKEIRKVRLVTPGSYYRLVLHGPIRGRRLNWCFMTQKEPDNARIVRQYAPPPLSTFHRGNDDNHILLLLMNSAERIANVFRSYREPQSLYLLDFLCTTTTTTDDFEFCGILQKKRKY